ncbi:MAG: hypothetical protein GY835_12080 [bacterium]|nr:hypothetical protein [bacterium]
MKPVYLLLISQLLFVCPCPAATIRVPDDQPTIQVGLDAATTGDTVLVAPGDYPVLDLDIRGKSIVLRSKAGADATILDAQGLGRVFVEDCFAGSLIEGFTLRNGDAEPGGAVVINFSTPVFEDCRFVDNHSDSDGGAVYCSGGWFDPGAGGFTSCEFRGNTARSGGAIMMTFFSSWISDCRFSDNSALEYGGALFMEWAGNLLCEDSQFISNQAGQNGGAIKLRLGPMGSAIQNPNGIKHKVRESIYIERSFFRDNQAVKGGAISTSWAHHAGPPPEHQHIRQCTIVENRAEEGSGIHSLWSFTGMCNIEQSIIAFNYIGQAISGNINHLIVTCCNVFGNEGGDEIDDGIQYANFSLDPGFCDPDGGDFTLAADSPCAPGNHPDGLDCGLIGMYPVDCPSTTAQETSWSRIKSLY